MAMYDLDDVVELLRRIRDLQGSGHESQLIQEQLNWLGEKLDQTNAKLDAVISLLDNIDSNTSNL